MKILIRNQLIAFFKDGRYRSFLFFIILINGSVPIYGQNLHLSDSVDFVVADPEEGKRKGLKPIRRLSDNLSIFTTYNMKDQSDLLNIHQLDNSWKLAPGFEVKKNNQAKRNILVQVLSVDNAKENFLKNNLKFRHINESINVFEVNVEKVKLSTLLEDSNIIFIDTKVNGAFEEATIRSHDLALNGIALTKAKYPELNGAGITVSLKERSIINDDIDIIDRYLLTERSDSVTSLHATEMATLIGGRGNSSYRGTGVADDVRITSANFYSVFADPSTYFAEYNISIQNNSYGSEINNYYGLEAQSYDNLIDLNPELAIIFSAGNQGEDTSPNGTYQGLVGYSNITGTYKQAKNIFIVGATDETGEALSISSRGPAYDGRVMPQIMAYGGEGSSDAAALVSGSVAVLQNLYYNKNNILPGMHLIKSVLTTGAQSKDPSTVSFKTGYGVLDINNSVKIIDEGHYVLDTISANSSLTYDLYIPTEIEQVRLALAWVDPAANPGDYKALVNDLDLSLRNKMTGELYQPWVLNPAPDLTKLSENAVRGIDSLNTIELVTLETPATGDYEIIIESHELDKLQPFAISYRFTQTNEFTWYYPVQATSIESGTKINLSWRSSYGIEPGNLFVDYGGGNWQQLHTNVDLAVEQLEVELVDTLALARLKMQVGLEETISDYFTIAPEPKWNVEFDCESESLLSWEPVEAAIGYRLEALQGKSFVSVLDTPDTSVLINKTANSYTYFKVSPNVTAQYTGYASSAIQPSALNVGCYIKHLTGSVNADNIGEIEVLLGTEYNVDKVELANISDGRILTMERTSPLTYMAYDAEASDGFQQYQASVNLVNGKTVTSDTLVLSYFKNDKAMVFPNPVQRGEGLLVVTAEQDPIFELIDTSGRPVQTTTLFGNAEYLYFEDLRPGIYIYRIWSDGDILESARLILY